ncbi:MAG TPA: sulfotransferase [Methylomirabilota bacterium]|nr:sulfotransferase [Methylomirabilota bacterium]
MDHRQGQTGVVVLGPYRSGTSMAASVLSALGVDFGPREEMHRGDWFNPRGYFERHDVNRANTAFIRSAGGTLADPGMPELLAARGDRRILEACPATWRAGTALWGVKDPRLSATLLSWVRFELFDPGRLRVVLLERDPESIVRSVMKFRVVRAYCGGTEAGARDMTRRYHDLAQWHVKHLDLPVFTLCYERMLAAPEDITRELASFLGIRDRARSHRAARQIGRTRGPLRCYSVDLPLRALRRGPHKIVRLIRGR